MPMIPGVTGPAITGKHVDNKQPAKPKEVFTIFHTLTKIKHLNIIHHLLQLFTICHNIFTKYPAPSLFKVEYVN